MVNDDDPELPEPPRPVRWVLWQEIEDATNPSWLCPSCGRSFRAVRPKLQLCRRCKAQAAAPPTAPPHGDEEEHGRDRVARLPVFRGGDKKKQERSCLKCGKAFMSDGPGNRMCPSCHDGNLYGNAHDVGQYAELRARWPRR